MGIKVKRALLLILAAFLPVAASAQTLTLAPVPLTNALRHSSFNAPTPQESNFQYATPKAEKTFPLGDRVGFVVPINPMILPRIVCLSLGVSPSAIQRPIVAVDVDTIQRIPAWALAHISQERREVVSPFMIDANAAPTVVFPAQRSRIFATCDHRAPRNVFPRSRLTVTSPTLSAPFIVKTATAFGRAISQVTAENVFSLTTGTATHPSGLFAESWMGRSS